MIFVAAERPRPSPRVCPCENGGICSETTEESSALADSGLRCVCPMGISGARCEYGGAQGSGGSDQGGSKATAIVVPIVVMLLVLFGVAAAWFVVRKRPL